MKISKLVVPLTKFWIPDFSFDFNGVLNGGQMLIWGYLRLATRA